MARRRLLIAISLLVASAAVAGSATLLGPRGDEPLGLDTELEDVHREPPRPRPVGTRPGTPATTATEIAPEPEPRPEPETPCWRQFGGNPQRTLARPALKLGTPAKPVWARGLGGYIEYPATYCDGHLYVNTFKGTTFAIEAETGRVLWQRDGARKPSSPAIAGERLIVSANDGTVRALERATGEELWRISVGTRVESSPLVVEGRVFFGAADGRLFAADTATGRVRWAYRTGGEINSSPTAFGNRICITNYAGTILCLRRADGVKVWSTTVRRDAFREESFYASASTDGERLYTIARSGKVVALSAASGRVVWTQRLRGLGYSTPAVSDGRVYVGGFDGALHVFDARTGGPVWRRRVGGRILGAPVVIGPLVFFATLEQKTYAARVSDGKLVWSVGMGKYSPAIATDDRYYMTLNGMLVAYDSS